MFFFFCRKCEHQHSELIIQISNVHHGRSPCLDLQSPESPVQMGEDNIASNQRWDATFRIILAVEKCCGTPTTSAAGGGKNEAYGAYRKENSSFKIITAFLYRRVLNSAAHDTDEMCIHYYWVSVCAVIYSACTTSSGSPEPQWPIGHVVNFKFILGLLFLRFIRLNMIFLV